MARKVFLGPLIIAVAALVGACGGSGKPSYCSSLDNLKSSVQAIPKTNVVQTGTNGLKAAVDKVQSDAKAVVSSAKSDFPNESSALETSINALTSSAKQLTSSPSAAAIAQVVSDVSGVSTAVKNFVSASSSKCG